MTCPWCGSHDVNLSPRKKGGTLTCKCTECGMTWADWRPMA